MVEAQIPLSESRSGGWTLDDGQMRCCRFRCWGRNGSLVCRIAQWNNESIGEWKEGRSNREFRGQVCTLEYRQVGALALAVGALGALAVGDICDVQSSGECPVRAQC